MRASRTYIAGLGATGVLIAASLLLLVVASTLVAFRGWPDRGPGGDAGSLVVRGDEPSVTVNGPQQVAADGAGAAGSVADLPATAAALAGQAAAPGTSEAVPAGDSGGGIEESGGGTFTEPPSAAPQDSETPQEGSATADGGSMDLDPVGGTLSAGVNGTVQGLTQNLGDTTSGLTYDLGQTVDGLNPALGQTIRNTGTGVSNLLYGVGELTRGRPRAR